MISLYIHIPFCKKKCNYCDFVSYAGKEELIDKYVEAICKEIKISPLSSDEVSDGVRTIFFGGGTPTLLELKHFEKILYSLTPSPSGRGGRGVRAAEISIESNPGTADKDKLKELRKLGINRLSIGAQSFNNQHLIMLGRIHTAEETLKFYNDARSAGFDNINIDLMFALPNQTMDEWKKDLQTAISLKPEHLSAYNLQIEENTPLALLATRYSLPDEETDLAMYEYTIEALKAVGYKHYEISNFAKPGFECQHNINYWKNGNYIGVGAGAHSHINGYRYSNPTYIEKYLETATLAPIPTSGFSRRFPETTPDKQETIFLGLRLLDGLPSDNFIGFEKETSELINGGLLIEEQGRIKLTKKGLYLGNLVFEKFV